MASAARDYLIKNKRDSEDTDITARDGEAALTFGTSIDLVPMLLANKSGVDWLPVFYLSGGKA